MAQRRFYRALASSALIVLLTGYASSLTAQEPPPPPGASSPEGDDDERTPPRLSYTHGEVSFWRPGADDWTRTQVNLPLAPGDALYAGSGANLELQIGRRAFIRAGSGTQIGLENQEPDFLQFRVTVGHASLDIREIESGHTVEIDTPNAVFTVERSGYYRIDVGDDTTTFVSRRGGRVVVTPADGEATIIAQNERVVIEGSARPTLATYDAADLDAWDRWNYERTGRVVETRSARYVPPTVYGTAELDEYGTWQETGDYGPVWTPRHVAADWAPYSDGRWIWDPGYGWTWIDDAPWGWAPAHYGRWVHVGVHWGWAPGPIVVAPVYTPAVVAFFGGSHVSVSIGISAPAVGWVALGWGEPVTPWWGHYVGQPSWRGWGGPRVVNNTVINNTTIVNNVNVYRNVSVPNAVVGVPQDRFGRGFDRGDFRRARIRQADIRALEPVRGRLPVQPVAESLTPRRERAARPPDAILKRPVVATRPPRDVAAPLRAQGLNVRDNPVSAPRIVQRGRPRVDAGVRRSDRAPGQAGRETQPQAAQPEGRDNLPGREAPSVGRGRAAGDAPQAPERGVRQPPPPAAERAAPDDSRARRGRMERGAPPPASERVSPAERGQPAPQVQQRPPAAERRDRSQPAQAERAAPSGGGRQGAPDVRAPQRAQSGRDARSAGDQPAAPPMRGRQREPNRRGAPSAVERPTAPAERGRPVAPSVREQQGTRREQPAAQRPARAERAKPAPAERAQRQAAPAEARPRPSAIERKQPATAARPQAEPRRAERAVRNQPQAAPPASSAGDAPRREAPRQKRNEGPQKQSAD